MRSRHLFPALAALAALSASFLVATPVAASPVAVAVTRTHALGDVAKVNVVTPLTDHVTVQYPATTGRPRSISLLVDGVALTGTKALAPRCHTAPNAPTEICLVLVTLGRVVADAATVTATITFADGSSVGPIPVALNPSGPMVVSLVGFSSASATLSTATRRHLDTLAVRLGQLPFTTITLSGRFDTRERASIASTRAEAVRGYLAARLPGKNITASASTTASRTSRSPVAADRSVSVTVS